MGAQAEWKVMTHMARVARPTSSSTRSRISCAALLVKVMARISSARAWPVRSRYAMRCVSTRVLPDPAPARMSRGPSPCVTASRWGSFRPSSRASILAVSGMPRLTVAGAPEVPSANVSDPILASDADRDIALALLREASVDGRLTLEDLAQRAELVHGARTRDDVAAATAGL